MIWCKDNDNMTLIFYSLSRLLINVSLSFFLKESITDTKPRQRVKDKSKKWKTKYNFPLIWIPDNQRHHLAEGKNISGEDDRETPQNLTRFFPEKNPQLLICTKDRKNKAELTQPGSYQVDLNMWLDLQVTRLVVIKLT